MQVQSSALCLKLSFGDYLSDMLSISFSTFVPNILGVSFVNNIYLSIFVL
jgi:hypothetical protein